MRRALGPLDLTESAFRRVFALARKSWGLPAEVTPHSLRHGGATHCYVILGMSIPDLKRRGRWAEEWITAYVQGLRSAHRNNHSSHRHCSRSSCEQRFDRRIPVRGTAICAHASVRDCPSKVGFISMNSGGVNRIAFNARRGFGLSGFIRSYIHPFIHPPIHSSPLHSIPFHSIPFHSFARSLSSMHPLVYRSVRKTDSADVSLPFFYPPELESDSGEY